MIGEYTKEELQAATDRSIVKFYGAWPKDVIDPTKPYFWKTMTERKADWYEYDQVQPFKGE